ncbi:ankyrin repeat domain-containing protein [Permianibacter aggregans]|uniref:Ankyrin repeat protein n=1 Tax=Permianibacter aggregans TaxID=1510150 RepID=A0A4R6UTT3_9GAMM|nr:ankyrin repeat domain-containing protein [Permianibacter aggregans]QGX40055.1 ankyrin repeat domain-containing protein [Permianibacter aggregans]TDQ49133.1 ankyrin repeat protein [Permianibacter aggregans]
MNWTALWLGAALSFAALPPTEAATPTLSELEQQMVALDQQIATAKAQKQNDKLKSLREQRTALQQTIRDARKQQKAADKAAQANAKKAAAEKTWEGYDPQRQLCAAIEYHRTDLVERVLKAGTVDLQKANDHCFFPLADAANRGHADIVELLLQHQSPLSMRFPMMNTLMSAIEITASSKEDRTTILDRLKRQGAGVHDSVEASLPSAVIAGGDTQSDQYLKDRFNIDKELMQSGGSLVRALKDGHVNNIAWLLKNGANAEESSLGKTALQYAIDSRDVEKVKLLVSAGANVNRASANFQSPLSYAEALHDKASSKRKESYRHIIDYLKSVGATYSEKEQGR